MTQQEQTQLNDLSAKIQEQQNLIDEINSKLDLVIENMNNQQSVEIGANEVITKEDVMSAIRECLSPKKVFEREAVEDEYTLNDIIKITSYDKDFINEDIRSIASANSHFLEDIKLHGKYTAYLKYLEGEGRVNNDSKN